MERYRVELRLPSFYIRVVVVTTNLDPIRDELMNLGNLSHTHQGNLTLGETPRNAYSEV